jgi:hypothetical protein
VPAGEEPVRRIRNGDQNEATARVTWLTLDQAVSDVFADAIRDGTAATAIVAAAQARDTFWAGLQSAATRSSS